MVDCGTITVEQSFAASDVSITDCSVGSSTVSPGQTVDLSVTVENANDVPASTFVQARIGGSQVREITVQLDANASRTVSLTITAPNSTGDHAVSATLSGIASDVPAGAPRTGSVTTMSAYSPAAPTPGSGPVAMADGGVEGSKDDCGCGCGGSCSGSTMFDVASAFGSF